MSKPKYIRLPLLTSHVINTLSFLERRHPTSLTSSRDSKLIYGATGCAIDGLSLSYTDRVSLPLHTRPAEAIHTAWESYVTLCVIVNEILPVGFSVCLMTLHVLGRRNKAVAITKDVGSAGIEFWHFVQTPFGS